MIKFWYITFTLLKLVVADEDSTLGMSSLNPASSCNQVYQRNPVSRGSIGKYWIKTTEGLSEVTCNMQLKCGGIEGGWMQVVDVDMNRDDSCPGTWHKITTPKRLCIGYSIGCIPANFDVTGVSYEHICGQAKAYQKGDTNAFSSKLSSVDSIYVDGISITLGSPRKHVWTYAAGLSDDYNYDYHNCPCATTAGTNPPAFVGNDYYCESGNIGTYESDTYYLSDPLWEGNGCSSGNGCCAQIGMPWFYRKLPLSVVEDFEIRICKNENHAAEDIAVEKLELYVL